MTAPKIIDLITRHRDHVHPESTLGEAVTQMLERKISSMIVVDRDRNRAVGILTEGDILHAMREHRSVALKVSSAMSSPVHSVPGTTNFRKAYREGARLGIRHIVVTDDSGQPVGVASESDFRRHLGPDFFRHLNDVNTLMDRLFPRLPPDASLDSALTAMEAARATCTVILEGRKPVGILTERDVVRLFLSATDNPSLAAVMTRPVITIGENCSLAEAAQKMGESGIRHLVAVDAAGYAVGLLTEHTLMRPLELDLVDDVLAERLALTQSRDAALLRTTRNEHYQRALLDNFPFPVWLKDTESRFLAVNRYLAEAMGQPSTDHLIGKTDFDFSPPALAGHYQADDAEVMARRQEKVVTEQLLIRDQILWHETYKAPVLSEDGSLLGTVGFAHDISARKRADEAMLLRNAALAGLIRGEVLVGVLELIALSVEAEMPDWRCAILLTDEAGKHLSCAAAPRLPEEYLVGARSIEIAEGVGSCGTAAALRQRVVVEDVFQHPHWVTFQNLARQCGFAACWAEPIFGPENELLGVFAVYHNAATQPREADIARLTQASQLASLVISHQRSAAKLESSRDTFRGIFDSVSETLIVLGEDYTFLDVNQGAIDVSGFPRQALIGRNYLDFGAPGLNDRATVEAHIAAAFAGTPQFFEFWVRNLNGRIFPLEVRLHPGNYFDRQVVIASVLDITKRKNAALRLEIEHDLARALASGMAREEVLGTILRAALRFHEFDMGAIYALRPDKGYQLIDQVGLSPELVAEFGAFDASSRQAAIAQAGKLVCSCSSSNGQCSPTLLNKSGLLKNEGLSCLAILPIVIDGETVACLNLGGHQTSEISGITMQALEALSRDFSQTLSRLATREEGQRLQENLSGLFDALDNFIFIVDQAGRIVQHNRAVALELGYGAQTLIGQPIAAVHPANCQKTIQQIISGNPLGKRPACTLPILHANGEIIMAETRAVMGFWNGQPASFCISQDISERLIAEERQKLAASVFDNAHEGIMITDPEGRIIEVNATFSELTGYTRAEAVGQNADLLKSGHHDSGFYAEMWQTIREIGFWRGEVWNRKKSGEMFAELLTISTVRNHSGEISQFVGIFSDITLIKQHQQRLEHLAHFDALTQLPNRMLLADRMHTAMAQTERNGKLLAVGYLDLDGFKPVNDLYGHAAGDRLLIEVAQRLKTCVRAGDTVSRLGGDEFVLLFSDLDNVNECDHAIARVISTLTQPFLINGKTISISASIGVTLFPNDGADSDTLLRHADQAMYAAKQSGRNRCHLFDPENDRRAKVRHDEISRIRQGLAQGEFALYYQPKVNMREGTVIGAEALIRWHHPELGLLLPGQFLPVIEGSEASLELGDWVIREALQQMEQWSAQGLDINISINIAGNHLQSPGFARRLGELLLACPNVSPSRLELEILETAALEDIALAAELFAECRKLGVSFSLDDFGTGYSSLTYFRRLPADILKIDQSFVRDMLDDPDDQAIVEGVIGLTQAFRRKVIAEGVETVEHGLVLLMLGCDAAQGYGIAHPMPADKVSNWVSQFRPDELWGSAASFRWTRADLPMIIAEVDHKRWKKKLYAHLEDPSGVAIATSDHRTCRFGNWYYSPESLVHAGIASFVALESEHSRVHRIGNELIEACARQETTRIEQLKQELEAASALLTENLHQFQAEVLLSGQAGKA